ncbi:MAG: hypothetical protein IRZ16_09840 [Myxococcaceae bacterium]|nr:hypothetical protein [Myxococcaceae bacterium]
MAAPVGIRWTIGDVSARGFEALGYSIRGAWRIFGASARYAVCVNTVPLEVARARVGPLPAPVEWIDATGLVPRWLRERFDPSMAEGTGWKFAPPQVFPDRYELSLDNDCILWDLPEAIARWLWEDDRSCVIAEDVRRCLGRFEALCGPEPRNSGIRGLPPGFPLERALKSVLAQIREPLTSELDEQGMQVALVERSGKVNVVRTSEVTICSPIWPHQPYLGRCGAHFVGLNARSLPFRYYGRPATEWVEENWRRLRPELDRILGDGAEPPKAGALGG